MKKRVLFAAVLSVLLCVAGCDTAENNINGLEAEASWQKTADTVEMTVGTVESEASAEVESDTAKSDMIESNTVEAAGETEAAQDCTLTVTFLDVGQGNAVLVEHEGEYMLVDGGDRDYASFVVSYLKEQNVEKLAYVISSHYDADHLNGVVGALNAFSCDLLLDADYTTDTRVYQSLCSVVKERSITEIHPDMGDVYTLGDAEFTIVCPDAYDYSDDNDNSIGIRLVHGDNSFLMLGDASSQMEWVMMMSGLTLQSDVYLASHHGSTYSTSDEFLAAVAPSCVVISAGYGNSYGHPTRRVLQAVKNSGASLYRTDLQGTVTVTSDGKDLTWNVEPTEDYRSGDELTKDTVSDKNTVSDGAAASDSSTGSDGNETSEEAVTANETDSTTEASYVLNTNTMKFHLPSCSSVNEIHEQNKAEFNGTREELISAGYAACKRCNP